MRITSPVRSSARERRVVAVMLAMLAIVVGLMILGPRLERRADLAVIRSSDASHARRASALLALCHNITGQRDLARLLPSLPLTQRLRVAQDAAAIGCLGSLDLATQAHYWLRAGAEPTDHIARLISFEASALEPALEAMETRDDALIVRAAPVLLALRHLLTSGDRLRLRRALERAPMTAGLEPLAHALGLPPPLKPKPEPEALLAPTPLAPLPSLRLSPPVLGRGATPSDGILYVAPADARPETL